MVSKEDRDDQLRGASKEAIREHYDVGNRFFSIWLDATMTYSSAVWAGAVDLEDAQRRKIDLHVAWSGALKADSVLDIGCGWGSLLERLVGVANPSRLVGLTLSDEQARHLRAKRLRSVDVRLESWEDHKPETPYGSIVSIGAIEHFVRPDTSPAERVEVYSRFFERCSSWLKPGGYMSLQTSAYQDGRFKSGAIASVFPESDLPTLSQLVAGIPSSLEVLMLRNDRNDYARTCAVWLERLRANRDRAVAAAGIGRVRIYESFLAAAVRGFEAGVFSLLRMQLRKRLL